MSRLSPISPPNFSEEYFFHLEHFFYPQIESFRKYIEFVQKHFKNEIAQIDSDVIHTKGKVKAGAIPAEYEDDVLWTHVEDYDLVNSFDRILIDSLAIQLFSMLEVELKYFCDQWASFSNKECKLKDQAGEHIIDRAKIYLKQQVKISETFSKKEWEFIQEYRLVRNALVHNKGVISKSEYEKFRKKQIVVKGQVNLGKYDPEIFYVSIPDTVFIVTASSHIYNFFQQLTEEIK